MVQSFKDGTIHAAKELSSARLHNLKINLSKQNSLPLGFTLLYENLKDGLNLSLYEVI